MAELTVGLGERSYPIIIEGGLLNDVGAHLKKSNPGNRYAIITDDKVAELYLPQLEKSLDSAGLSYESFIFAAGEESKNLATFSNILSQLAQKRLDRGACVIALGGGVVGDLAGFIAASYMRGIAFVQIPTTLLSQVDSSVGGKTGVDLPEGKNLVGAFYQPKAVFIDPDVLKTLPEQELLGGLAEVIKYGVIWSEEFFQFLDVHRQEILQLDPKLITEAILTSCRIKAEVVAKDEREGGLRRILNFGHTLGHAIETESEYKLIHGLAVSIGMAAAAKISQMKGLIDSSVTERIIKLLTDYEMPVTVPEEYNRDNIVDHLLVDKKVINGKVIFVLCKSIGETKIVDTVTDEEIRAVLG